MTINFLDLYNDVASQPWSMFDAGAEVVDDFEPALVSSINKAIINIWYSYPFPFRIKKHKILTMPNIASYELPSGNIINESSIEDNLFNITINGEHLNYVTEFSTKKEKGLPTEFMIEEDKIILSPTPDKKYSLVIRYLTLSIGFDKDNNELFYLEKPTDYIDIPQKYESLFKNVILAKTQVDSIVSINDENYAGYRLQFDKAYKLLIKISNPIKKSMSIKF